MKNKPENKNQIPCLPIYMSIGLSVGMAIGAAIGNISVGMCLGLAIGVGIGSALDAQNRKKENDIPEENEEKSDL